MNNPIINLSSEKIFFTIQGECILSGVPSVFIRLSGCNLRCAWKKPDGEIVLCDTPHTSFDPEYYKTPLDEIIAEVVRYDCDHVVITGGEPFIYNQLEMLVSALKSYGKHVSIETNGTKFLKTSADLVVISQKLKSSGASEKFKELHESKRLNQDALCQFFLLNNSIFKFVINDESDWSEISSIIELVRNGTNLPLKQIMDKVYLMPMGITAEDIQSKMTTIFYLCKKHKVKYSDRLHVRAYGHQKGV